MPCHYIDPHEVADVMSSLTDKHNSDDQNNNGAFSRG